MRFYFRLINNTIKMHFNENSYLKPYFTKFFYENRLSDNTCVEKLFGYFGEKYTVFKTNNDILSKIVIS